jgi:ABC-type transporter MlaC component
MSSLGRLLAGAGGLALLVSAWPAAADAAETGMPRQVVEQTVESVLGVLRQELPKEERRARLEEIVYDRFDFRTMSRLVLARNWKKLDGDQKEPAWTATPAKRSWWWASDRSPGAT